MDFKEINGQGVLRRAAEVAAAGMHGLLMCGSAGTGKSMVASRIPTILPGLTREEDIEISKVYSVCASFPLGVRYFLSGPSAVPTTRFLLRALPEAAAFRFPENFHLLREACCF